MNLTHEEKRELRDLGWSVARREARRPAAIKTRDTLDIDDHVTIDGETQEPLLIELDDKR